MSLTEVWEGAAGSPFSPLIGKDWQFLVGFSLLLTGPWPQSCYDDDDDGKAHNR